MLSDLRFAIRLLIKQPVFTLITAFVLAIGIGANTAIFSVVDAVLLRPLPYPDADRLVQVSNFWRKTGLRGGSVSAPDFHDWHDQSTVFDGFAAYNRSQTSVAVDGAADYAVVTRATPEFFPLMNARTELGRLPDAAEERAGGPLAVVVSHAFWVSHLGGDRSALGRNVTLRGPRLHRRRRPDAGVPVSRRHRHLVAVVGDPGDDVALGAQLPHDRPAQARRHGRAGAVANSTPSRAARSSVSAEQRRQRRRRRRPPRAAGAKRPLDAEPDLRRRGDRAADRVRQRQQPAAGARDLALGRAGDPRRDRRVARPRGPSARDGERAARALVAGVMGVLIAAWGIRGLVAIAPAGLPRLNEVAVDGRVLLFASVDLAGDQPDLRARAGVSCVAHSTSTRS